MARLLLLLTLFAGALSPWIPSASEPYKQLFMGAASGAQQTPLPLTEGQLDAMLKKNGDDEIIAGEIGKSGIDFRVDPEKLERLLKQGTYPQTRKALLLQEARAAYAEFSTEKNPATRLNLGKAFLQRHNNSPDATKVPPELRKIELELFEAAFNAFSANPSLPGLETTLKLGSNLLSQYSDRATEVKVNVRLALATSKGMINNFYSDLALSQAYAQKAQALLESPTPPPDFEPQSYSQLRANGLGLIYQSLGHYLLRQTVPDPEQAIVFLTKAAESKDSVSANDPFTYFLRASARDRMIKKLNEEYLGLPKPERGGRQGRSRCAMITDLIKQLTADYSQVLYFSGLNNAPQLKEEATNALQALSAADRPCLAGSNGPIAEWPSEEKRCALVIGVEDYLDKQVGKFNYAASDARDVAEVLIRNGGFRKEQVVLLTTDASDPADRPGRNVILQQLVELQNRVQQDGLLLIYFVGHAIEKAGKTYLLATDSFTANESRLSESAINIERFKEEIRNSGAGQVMLIFDSFRQTPASETFRRQLSFDVRKNEVNAFAIFLSASPGEHSYDSTSKKHGHFTSLFLEAARGRAANKNRDVTLDTLIKYLQVNIPKEVQREQASGVQHLSQIVEGYDAETLEVFSADGNGQPAAQPAASTLNLAELARGSSTIYIRSKTVWLNKAALEAELRKLPEFQASKLKVVNDAKDADLVVEVTLPVLTWAWNYTVVHRTSTTSLFSGKLRGLTDESVSPKLAKDIVSRLKILRGTQ